MRWRPPSLTTKSSMSVPSSVARISTTCILTSLTTLRQTSRAWKFSNPLSLDPFGGVPKFDITDEMLELAAHIVGDVDGAGAL